MILRTFLLMTVLLFAGILAHAQKAYPVDLSMLMSRIALPQSSASCYGACAKSTDADGAVSITGTGDVYSPVNDPMNKLATTAMADAGGAGMPPASMTTPPSPDQIEQMKQQAMARAMQAQTMNAQQAAQQYNNPGAASSRPSQQDIELMKLMGQAQTDCGKIQQIVTEFSAKYRALDHGAPDNIPAGPSCPEVRQGSYVGPTCECEQGRAVAYETKRVEAYDVLLPKVDALIQEYRGKLLPLLNSIDQTLAKTKYGDAFSNPMYKQQTGTLQRQALGAVATLLAAASNDWQGSAEHYARLVNVKNGIGFKCKPGK